MIMTVELWISDFLQGNLSLEKSVQSEIKKLQVLAECVQSKQWNNQNTIKTQEKTFCEILFQ